MTYLTSVSNSGELLTRLTVWLALTAYGGTCAALLARGDRPGRAGWVRVLWSIGCLVFLAHVACAFAFYHAWSHADAYRDTAAQTEAMTGWRWGGGLYFNYLFALLWIGDALWWWLAPDTHARRPVVISVALHGFFFFMVVNGAVVFARAPMRWFGLALCVGLTVLWARRLSLTHRPSRG